MRRIRHVVLPVRSWHYIGLLIVSLACLTLGLVSRDREGHAGSLAGPELIYQAPHESDSCPNLNPFIKMPSCSTSVSEEILKPVNEIKVSRVSPTSRRTVSRSMSLDRSLRLSSRETRQSSGSRDLLQAERISRSRTRVSNDEFANRLRESRSRIIVRSREIRNSYDPAIRLSRSRDLSNRATDRRSVENRLLNSERRSADRFNKRRLQYTERHELNEVAQNRVDQSMNRQVSPNRQRRTNNLHDRKSLSIERRILSDTNRQESRTGSAERRNYRDLTQNRVDRRSEMRDNQSRFAEQRAIERREAERSSRRENRRTLNRSAIVSRENLNLQTRGRSLKNRGVLLARVANQEHTSRSAARDYQDNLVIPNNRRSLSRSVERLSVNDLGRATLRRQARSIDNERSSERKSSERRNLARSMERREMQHAGRRKLESKDRLTNQRSFDRATSQVSPENLRRERVSLSQRSQDSRRNKATGEQSRSISSRSRYDLEENANQKRQARFSRSVDRNSMDERSRSWRNSPAERRDLTQARRERTNRLYRFREEQGTVPQRSRETEQRMSGRILERRVLERRVAPDSARLDSTQSERRIDNSKSREESRTRDRRLDSRMSYREKMIEERSARDSQRSTGRKIDARLSERSRMEDRRLERSLESRLSRGRVLKRRSTLESRRSSEQGIGDSSRSREESRMANRRLERNLESRDSRNRMLEKRTDSTRGSIDRRTDESTRLHESRIQNRRLERNSELRNSIAMRRMERAVNSRELLESRISRLSDKRSDSRNLQDMRAEKNMEVRKIVPKTIEDYRLHKHSVTYDFLRQAFLVGLCTVYGLSFYGKKSLIGNNIMQQAQRFLVW